MVKELRELTGAGMMDCKAALTETNGEMTAAQDWLRKKGLSKAAKKAGRVAAEGLIGVQVAGTKGVVVEVNSETDFVARNDLFQGLVKMVAGVALSAGTDVEKIKAAKVGSITVADAIADTIAKIGENMTLRRAAALSVGKARSAPTCTTRWSTASARSESWSRSNPTGKADELVSLGRMVAMHVAASNPQAIEASGLDPAVVAREKEVLADKFKQQGKPANVIEKIVESGLKTYYKEVCLLEQVYVHDDKKTVAQALKEAEGKVGARSRSPGSCVTRSARASRSGKAISPPRSRPPPVKAENLGAFDPWRIVRDGRSRSTDASLSNCPARRSPAPKDSASIRRRSSRSPTISWPRQNGRRTRRGGRRRQYFPRRRSVRARRAAAGRRHHGHAGNGDELPGAGSGHRARRARSAHAVGARDAAVCETYKRKRALKNLGEGRVVLLAAGTGNPFFTTDTTAVLRAAELECQVVLKATNVDGVYSADPKKDRKAKRYEKLSHQEAIEKRLQVMDSTAFALARENHMPIIVFSIADKGAIKAVLRGKARYDCDRPGRLAFQRERRRVRGIAMTSATMTSTKSSAACRAPAAY